MQRKFDKFSALSVLFIILLGITDYFLDSNYSEYLVEVDKTKLLLENKIVYRCIKENEIATFNMSKEGLHGQCGTVGPRYNPVEDCYEFYTYGEQINASEVVQTVINLVENAPSQYIKISIFNVNVKYVRIARWLFLGLALFFSILAITKGFKQFL